MQSECNNYNDIHKVVRNYNLTQINSCLARGTEHRSIANVPKLFR